MASSIANIDGADLVPVSLESLRGCSELAFDLYVCTEEQGPSILLCTRGYPLHSDDLARLKQRGVTTLFTPASMADDYGQHLRELVLTDERLPTQERFEILRQAARTVFASALRVRDSENLARAGCSIGRTIAEFATRSQPLFLDLTEVMLQDYSSFTHLTNVAVCAVLLAGKLGISDPAELAGIASGALLHDMGKLFIDQQVLKKRKSRTPEEQHELNTHPRRGFEAFCRRPDLSWGSLMMIYQHHETYEGNGFPTRLVGREIHPWARICSIVNVFDHLQHDHGIHSRSGLAYALEYLDRQVGRAFDEDMVRCWIATTQQS